MAHEQDARQKSIGAARRALNIHSGEVGDSMEPVRDRIVDLVVNLLHLAHAEGLSRHEAEDLANTALMHFGEEASAALNREAAPTAMAALVREALMHLNNACNDDEEAINQNADIGAAINALQSAIAN